MGKAKKAVKKENKKAKSEKEESPSLDDAFADDEDVVYAQPKPRKEKKKKLSEDEIEEELEEAEEEEAAIGKAMNGNEDVGPREITFKTSKPIAKIRKGDRIKIDGVEYMVDAHEIMIDHGSTKEMSIDIFEPKSDKDLQLRYFDDQVESTLDLYELREIMYFKKPFKKIEW